MFFLIPVVASVVSGIATASTAAIAAAPVIGGTLPSPLEPARLPELKRSDSQPQSEPLPQQLLRHPHSPAEQ